MLNSIVSNKPFSTARLYFLSGGFWGVIGALYGLVAALALIAPDLISQNPVLSFGRLRPVHVNIVAFGFVYSLLLGAGAYYAPGFASWNLCGTKHLVILG